MGASREVRLVPDDRHLDPAAYPLASAARHMHEIDDASGCEFLDDQLRFQD